ncbi:MAG: TonB-dependent siderophore receptor [Proteobacteria bacterium]|nr:TonB-dependent siderophore receptor [Pseudomonadota bacterium]
MSKRVRVPVTAFILPACLLTLGSGVAYADTAADQPEAADRGAGKDPASDLTKLEEVVVRGRKLLIDTHNVNVGAFGSKDVLDIPLDIVSYSSALLENQIARTLDDVIRNDPGVSDAAVGGAYDNVRIRGFSVDWTNTMRRDGLSLAPYQDVPLENIDRVDVLKGPSGFLYGFNSPGGTINFIPKQPTREPFNQVTAQWRNYDGYYAHLDTSHTLGAADQFGYRLNLAYEKVGNFQHSGDLARRFAGASVNWKLSDRAVLQLNGDWQEKDLAAQPVIGLQADGSLPPMVDPRTLLGQPWFKYRTNVADAEGRLDYTLSDDWYLVTQVAYGSNTRDAAFPDIYAVDARGNILSGDLVLSPQQPYAVYSGQSFLSGKFKTGFIGHELVTGVSAREYEAHESGYATLTTNTVGNLFQPVYFAPIPLPEAPAKNHVVNHQVGPFVSDLITLTQSWQLLLGGRYIHYSNTSTPAAGAPRPYAKNSFVPSAGLIYKPLPDVMTYFNYSRGLEQSQGAPFFAKNVGVALNPLVSTQYEVGVKARVAGEVTLGMAAFEIKKSLEFVDSNNYFVQSGLQRHRGLELTGSGGISRNTNLIAGVAWLDAVQVNTGDTTVDGRRTENVPKWQANLSLDTRIEPVPGLSTNVGVNYVGNRAVGAQNIAFIPSYVRVDAGARYLTQMLGYNFIFRAALKNITNKRYWAGAEYTSVYPGQPRLIYLSVSADF